MTKYMKIVFRKDYNKTAIITDIDFRVSGDGRVTIRYKELDNFTNIPDMFFSSTHILTDVKSNSNHNLIIYKRTQDGTEFSRIIYIDSNNETIYYSKRCSTDYYTNFGTYRINYPFFDSTTLILEKTDPGETVEPEYINISDFTEVTEDQLISQEVE